MVHGLSGIHESSSIASCSRPANLVLAPRHLAIIVSIFFMPPSPVPLADPVAASLWSFCPLVGTMRRSALWTFDWALIVCGHQAPERRMAGARNKPTDQPLDVAACSDNVALTGDRAKTTPTRSRTTQEQALVRLSGSRSQVTRNAAWPAFGIARTCRHVPHAKPRGRPARVAKIVWRAP